ncbi:MAG TPA: 16S rRNA (uracil(1498)-N(3))-methyltransferase [Vicinamibacterales bacterium]
MDKPRPVARVYAPEARGNRSAVDLPPDEAHYLTHVLRLRVGDDVAVFDGAGREWTGRVAAGGQNGVRVELGQSIDPVPEPGIRVVLAIGLLKGDQMDSVVRDATMLGVAEILPMITAHVAVSGRARESGKAIGRWTRVAIASARQCGRAVVPRIGSITSFETVLRETDRDQMVIATEPAVASAAVLPAPERPQAALVLVGPEGGWSREEIERALLEGARPRQLGLRTLRAESAPIVLLSALWTEWGWT